MPRWPLLLAALVVPLAGCVTEEGDAEDGGTRTQTVTDFPTGSATGTGTGGGGGHGFAPQQGTARGERDGIVVEVRWRACEEGFCANATATNNGTGTVRISSICESPWTDRMSRDGQPVQHREPQAVCAAYGRADFAPGDRAFANLTWDQRVHDDAGAHPAPEGAYTWSIAFWWEPQDGQPWREAAADVQLIVGET